MYLHCFSFCVPHPGVRPFPCPHCDKIFRTSGHRKTHIASHFKSLQQKRKFPRKTSKTKVSKSNLPLPDIPLQEPILITDFGQSTSRIFSCALWCGVFRHLNPPVCSLVVQQASSHPRTRVWLSSSTWRWWAVTGHTSASSVIRPIRNQVI